MKDVVKNCPRCKIIRAVPYKYPGQPKLPLERLQARRPFTCVAVDYSGPHTVRVGYDRVNHYVCLFTCLVSRGVYLVRKETTSAKDFVYALYELMARRGKPELLLSDNATNFTCTAAMMKKLSKEKLVKDKLCEINITWKFLPPEAPWQGGTHERLIGLMKKELNKLTRNGIFTGEEFDRHLWEIEEILNSRPLCRGDGDNEVITPSHFLNNYNNLETEFTPMNKEIFLEEVLRSRKELPALFKHVQVLRETFWQRLWSQYLDKHGMKDPGMGGRNGSF